MLTTVAAFREPWEAHMFRSRLNAEGISASVAHELHVGNAWHWSLALWGAKVQVPEEDVQDARTIEQLCRNGEFKSQLEQDFGDLDDIRCPHCGSTDCRRRRPILEAATAIAISFLARTIFPPLGWVYFCNQCGTKYEAPLYERPVGEWLNIWIVTVCETILLIALVVFMWTLQLPRYRFVALVIAAVFAAGCIGRWISRLEADQE